MDKMWAGRFSEKLNELADDFNSSLRFDCRMYKQDIKGSMAHAEMLASKGIISLEDSKLIVEGLGGILEDIETGKLTFDAEAEDIHMFIESELTLRIGDAGKRLHTARSRNDQVALDIRMYLRDEITEISEMLINSVTFAYIQKAQTVKDIMFANVANKPATASQSDTANYIKQETGIDVYIDDEGYYNDGTFTKFVADGTVVLMPAGKLGNTWFGTTPEESDLMNGVGTKASVKVVDTGVAVATYKEEDPVTVITKVSELVLPSFEMADCVIIASVKTGG